MVKAQRQPNTPDAMNALATLIYFVRFHDWAGATGRTVTLQDALGVGADLDQPQKAVAQHLSRGNYIA